MNIFLSYENGDRHFIDDFTSRLREIDVYPLIVDLQLVIGDPITSNRDTQLNQILKNCEFVVVVLSTHHAKSKWLQKELFAFLALERMRGTDLVLPIVIENCQIPVLLEDRICADFSDSFEVGFEQLKAYLSRSRKAFVVMKFADKRLNSAYKTVIKPILEEFKYSPLRIDEKKRGRKITDDILDEIRRSEIVFADLSGSRPNCYYEAGYAHALEKEIIFTIRLEDAPPHFDLKDYRFIIWDTEDELADMLRQTLEEIRQESLNAHKSKARPDSKTGSATIKKLRVRKA